MAACSGNKFAFSVAPRTSCPRPNYSVLGKVEEKELPSVTKLQFYCIFIFLLTEYVTVWTKLGEGQNRERNLLLSCVLLSASLPIKSVI